MSLLALCCTQTLHGETPARCRVMHRRPRAGSAPGWGCQHCLPARLGLPAGRCCQPPSEGTHTPRKPRACLVCTLCLGACCMSAACPACPLCFVGGTQGIGSQDSLRMGWQVSPWNDSNMVAYLVALLCGCCFQLLAQVLGTAVAMLLSDDPPCISLASLFPPLGFSKAQSSVSANSLPETALHPSPLNFHTQGSPQVCLHPHTGLSQSVVQGHCMAPAVGRAEGGVSEALHGVSPKLPMQQGRFGTTAPSPGEQLLVWGFTAAVLLLSVPSGILCQCHAAACHAL